MKKLSDLFATCVTLNYKEAGDDVNYQFIEEGSTLLIFFEGSNSITDGVRNFGFFKKPYKDMKIPYYVHSGFLAAGKEVEDIIISKIVEKDKDKEYKWKEIYVVGYSHGGALAAFCHECCWFGRKDIKDKIYGFGFEAPRIYRGFRVKKALRERGENFVVTRNCKDIVTHCPPAIFCFTHVGKVLKVGKKSKGCIQDHMSQNVHPALKEYEDEN